MTINPFAPVSPVQPSTMAAPNTEWRNQPASGDQIVGKRNYQTGQRSGGIRRLLNTKDLSGLSVELQNVLLPRFNVKTEEFEFEIVQPGWYCTQLTKGQASDIMSALLKAPNKPRRTNSSQTIAGAVTVTQMAPVTPPKMDHVDLDGFRLVQLPSGETLQFKLKADGTIDHRSKPTFVK